MVSVGVLESGTDRQETPLAVAGDYSNVLSQYRVT